MSRVLFVDASAGVAGDMLVAALVHAGAPLDGVLEVVRRLPVFGWTARVEPVLRGAYAATRFVVEAEAGWSVPEEARDHAHDHDHGGHSHAHHRAAPLPAPFAGQPSRSWRQVRTLIERADLPPRVRERALAAFGALAEAEARVHGTPVEAVAFHEVGAVDSIVDTVAVCAALELLGVDRLVCTPLPMGRGRVHTEHGLLPVPVPAVVEVLRGWPVEASPWEGELVTPTGAALVVALAEPGWMPSMRVESVGYGAGTRNPSTHANVVRVVLGAGEAGGAATVAELHAQVDDLPGEAVPPLLDALFAAGAVDAWVMPVTMKKGRPGLLVGALCAPDARAGVGEALLAHSGSFGYRWSVRAREVVAREVVTVDTAFGPVRVKVGTRGGVRVHAAPEFEDCAARAREAGVPVGEVYRAAWRAFDGGEPKAGPRTG